MYRFHNNSPVYDIPFKTEIPCMEYDFAVYCHKLKTMVSIPLPLYMEEFRSFLDYYPKQIKKLKPKTFPVGKRIYIVDNRLNFIFATIDTTGDINKFFRHYGKHGLHMEDYSYGSEETANTSIDSLRSCNKDALMQFKIEYDALPLDELTLPTILILDQDRLEEYRNISFFQSCTLMEKYRSENYIDWHALVDQLDVDYCVL